MKIKNAKQGSHRKCDYNKDSFWTHRMDIRKYHQKKWMHLRRKKYMLSVKAAVELTRTKQISRFLITELQGGLMKTLFFICSKKKSWISSFVLNSSARLKHSRQSGKSILSVLSFVITKILIITKTVICDNWGMRKGPGDQSMWFKSQSFPSLIKITPDNTQHKAKFCGDPSY